MIQRESNFESWIPSALIIHPLIKYISPIEWHGQVLKLIKDDVFVRAERQLRG